MADGLAMEDDLILMADEGKLMADEHTCGCGNRKKQNRANLWLVRHITGRQPHINQWDWLIWYVCRCTS
jgi:hypothetical protein